MKIHRIEKLDCLKRGQWWVWSVEVEMGDGTTREGICEGDEHGFAEETLELEPD